MKKTVFLLLAVLVCSLVQAQETNSQECINFSVQLTNGAFDPKPIGIPVPKSPIQPPTVYIDDYTLSFEADHPEYVLSIKDEEDEVVYTTVVSSSQTQVILPSTLSGEYKIELIMGNWLFTGWINL